MFGILRYIVLALMLVAVFRILKRYFFGSPQRHGSGFDSNKEVKNASYKVEDIQDAKFKDIH
ncbi:hypothetical protein K1X84_14745 [bacterium]|nr:hypothetical protein [bacterium]